MVGATTQIENGKGTLMALRRVQSSLVRLALVAGFAMAFFVGAVGFAGPSHASAAPKSNGSTSSNFACGQSLTLATGHRAAAQVLENAGNAEAAAYHRGKADGIADAHYPCGDWGGNKGK